MGRQKFTIIRIKLIGTSSNMTESGECRGRDRRCSVKYDFNFNRKITSDHLVLLKVAIE